MNIISLVNRGYSCTFWGAENAEVKNAEVKNIGVQNAGVITNGKLPEEKTVRYQ